MTLKNIFKMLATLSTVTLTGTALAHDGHGMTGSHWHATDVSGFVALGVALALAIWLSRDGK